MWDDCVTLPAPPLYAAFLHFIIIALSVLGMQLNVKHEESFNKTVKKKKKKYTKQILAWA